MATIAVIAWANFGFVSQAAAQTAPQELRDRVPAASLAGSSRLKYWGFDVYNASLWVAPGFKASDYDQHLFALELVYLRNFTSEDIARRSLDEMRRQPGFPATRSSQWQQALRNAFPDVRPGDRISGINRPGVGVQFLTNGQPTGTMADPDFAKLFFGIWLARETSEPALRDALLAGAQP